VQSVSFTSSIFQRTPPPDPVVQFWLLATFKTAPIPDDEFQVSVTLVRSNGEREKLNLPLPTTVKIPVYEGDPSIPGGFNIAAQINLVARNMGTGYLEINLDGEMITRVPFTLRQLKPEVPNAGVPQ